MTQKNKTPWIERRIIFQDLEKTDSILPPNSELKDALNELQQEFGIGVHDMNSYRNILYTKDMILFNSVKDNKYRGSDLTRTLELCPYKRIHEILEEQTMHEAYKKEENQHSESHIKKQCSRKMIVFKMMRIPRVKYLLKMKMKNATMDHSIFLLKQA